MYAEMWADDARAGIAEQTPGPGLVYVSRLVVFCSNV